MDNTVPSKEMTNQHPHSYINTAAFIVGCLVADGLIEYDVSTHMGAARAAEESQKAILMIATILQKMHPINIDCDWPTLPVDYLR